VTKETMLDTQAKVASVRSISRTNRQIVERGEARPPRSEFAIVGGILAVASGWSPLIGDALREL